MKTAERENPNRRPQCVANRADGAASQYRSCSIMWAAKQENFQPAEKCFFLTSPFIEHCIAGQGHETRDGASDLGKKDRHHCMDRVEERSKLRRPIPETTNSLSVSDRVRSIPGFLSGGGRRFSRHSGSRASLNRLARRSAPRSCSLTVDPRPSRITRKSDGPRVPNRTMVANLTVVLLCWFRN